MLNAVFQLVVATSTNKVPHCIGSQVEYTIHFFRVANDLSADLFEVNSVMLDIKTDVIGTIISHVGLTADEPFTL